MSAAEELSNVKQAMAMMSRQHYMEVKRLRDGTSGATSSPLSGSQSTAACSLEPAGDATSSPPPAHRLHIQLHQKERQLAEATAAAQAEATKREALVSSCRPDSTTQSCCLPGLAAAWEASSASSLTLLSHTPTHPSTHPHTHTRHVPPPLTRVCLRVYATIGTAACRPASTPGQADSSDAPGGGQCARCRDQGSTAGNTGCSCKCQGVVYRGRAGTASHTHECMHAH